VTSGTDRETGLAGADRGDDVGDGIGGCRPVGIGEREDVRRQRLKAGGDGRPLSSSFGNGVDRRREVQQTLTQARCGGVEFDPDTRVQSLLECPDERPESVDVGFVRRDDDANGWHCHVGNGRRLKSFCFHSPKTANP
jgi:hypothetical protein